MKTLNQISLTLLMLGLASTSASAQTQYHQPLNQRTPPGQSAAWMNVIRRYSESWMQPMQVEIDGGGTVEVYSGSSQSVGIGTSPCIVAGNAGHLYRLKISSMPGFPELDLYPTIELLDRMHPPQGREDEFPIPIILHKEDMEMARRGQLVTRVIYLEQPQIAQVVDPLRREIAQTVLPSENALQQADVLGRPMAILRIGGRAPSVNTSRSYFGTGGAVQVRPAVATEKTSASGKVTLTDKLSSARGL